MGGMGEASTVAAMTTRAVACLHLTCNPHANKMGPNDLQHSTNSRHLSQ